MSLPLNPDEYTQVAQAARIADERALDHPAKLAAYLDRNWEARAHTDLISRSLVDLATGTCQRLLITTPPQIGKPVYVGSMILMGDGSRKPLSDVHTGDTVITHNARSRRVTAVHEQGQKPCVRITTHAGRETITATDHPFLTPEGWVKAGELQEGEALATVPRVNTQPADEIAPHEARLMGYFLGDGSTSHGNCQITTASPAVDLRIRDCADSLGFDYWTATPRSQAWELKFRGGARTWLRQHGLQGTSYTKRVPDAVFRSRPAIIAEFIAGYWDCDGVVSSRGKGRDGKPRQDVHCELYSVSWDLMNQVQHLLLRLGIRSMIRTKKGSYNDAEHISYRLAIIARDDVAKFRKTIELAHEKRSAALTGHTLPRSEFDAPYAADPIAEIEHIGDRECRCLTVDEDHTFTSDDLVVHNSTLVSEWFPFWWLVRNPRHRVIVGSYGTSLANRRGRVVRRLVREHGWRWDLNLEHGAAGVAEWTLETGGGLKSVGVGSAVTGSPADCVAGGTLIHTEAGLIPAARLARMPKPPRVAGWDHPRARFGWFPLVAVRSIRAHQLREIITEGGRSLWCTHDHPVYVIGRGYVRANTVKPGEELIAGNEPAEQVSDRPFPMGGTTGETTRPALRPGVNGAPLPQRRRDWVRRNKPLRTGRSHTVYDFQIRHANNFLADGILAHNCAIVDDPHKNRAEAESLVTRDKVWDWWSADITSRLAPGAPIVLVCTLWHEDDLPARVLDQDGREEHGGMWRIIRLPAFADTTNDALGRMWGEPLPHPKIPEDDQDSARKHWDVKRNTSLVRDWHALYQADPQPNEGSLVTAALLRSRRHIPPPVNVEPQRTGVAIDPSGGGRDLAGIIAGHLMTDGRLYLTHDASRNGHSEVWSMEAALLAAETHADFVIMEKNYGGDMSRIAFDSAWDTITKVAAGYDLDTIEDGHARRAQALDTMPAKPQLKLVTAKKGKLLRAEPIAQQFAEDRLRLGEYLPSVEHEWCSWQVSDPNSPGRIDASVYLAFELLPIPGSEALVSTATSLTRSQITWESQRRNQAATPAQPQLGARIERTRMRPGMPTPGQRGFR